MSKDVGEKTPRVEEPAIAGSEGQFSQEDGHALRLPNIRSWLARKPQIAVSAPSPITPETVVPHPGDLATPAAAPADAQVPLAVEFKNVTKVYRKGTPPAILDVSFAVEDIPDKGEFITILGQSGCGKSTLLRLIAGLGPQHPPTSGTVSVLGKQIEGPGRDRGMVFQDYTSFEYRSVLDNIAFGLECSGMGKKERLDLARESLARVGLAKSDGDKYPQDLSGGMRQRVAIARTLILKPRVILMDEPFGALDAGIRYKMQDLLVSLWRETRPTILFVTHSIEEAVYLGDRTILMAPYPGRIVEILKVPEPDRPAQQMQREPGFMDVVFAIRDKLEATTALPDVVTGSVPAEIKEAAQVSAQVALQDSESAHVSSHGHKDGKHG